MIGIVLFIVKAKFKVASSRDKGFTLQVVTTPNFGLQLQIVFSNRTFTPSLAWKADVFERHFYED